jgi:hypothetical protein
MKAKLIEIPIFCASLPYISSEAENELKIWLFSKLKA